MWTRKRCPGTWSILSRFSLRPRSPGTERAVSRSRVRDCLVVIGVKQAMLLGILSTQEEKEEEESGSGVNIIKILAVNLNLSNGSEDEYSQFTSESLTMADSPDTAEGDSTFSLHVSASSSNLNRKKLVR